MISVSIKLGFVIVINKMKFLVILASLIALALEVTSTNPCDLINSYAQGKLTMLMVDGRAYRLTKINPETTLAQLRKCQYLEITKSQFFFSATKLIEQNMEEKVTIQEILQEKIVKTVFGMQQTVLQISIKTAPPVNIQVLGSSKVVYMFQESSLLEIRYLLQLSTSTQFYINSYAVVISEESKITYQDISFGGVFIVDKLTTDTTKVVTKETLSIAMNMVKINIMIESVFLKQIQIVSTTTVQQLRTQLSLNSSQFFFSQGCLVYLSNEQSTKVSEITQTIVNGTSKILSVSIKTAPKLELVIDNKSQFIFAF